MKHVRFNLAAGAAALLLCAFIVGSTVGQAQTGEGGYGVGIPDSLLSKYLAFRAGQLSSGAAQVLRIRLGYVKGLSRSFTALAGELTLDLQSGAFRVSLNGLTAGQSYGVWLVDGAEGSGTTAAPDTVLRLATVLATTPSAVVAGTFATAVPNVPLGFKIDRIVVSEGIQSPSARLASGSVNVLQKIFFRRLSLVNEGAGTVVFEETTAAPRLFDLVPDLVAETDAALPLTDASSGVLALATTASALESEPITAAATAARSVRIDRLISRGATLFFEATFGGNGRTCGTCHPANNNFTIDPDFIRRLPANDPLFVAEFNPALAQLERPQLMRAYGLILENLDGLSDPANRFVMRGVPPTLGLQVTLQQDTSLAGAPTQMTGWSGDGSPGTGSLREFAIGAVTQHFTRRLARVAGRDFRLPTEHQLDAMEAFQLSLGRSADFDLSKFTFLDQNVQTGRSLFVNGTGDPAAAGTCGFCHNNAGALSVNGQNRNFNTNVEDVPHPARNLVNFPKDGGFGLTANPDGSFGDRSFNIASVAEAADTPPFFHNNVVSTLEGVVEFYAGPEFNAPPRTPATRFSFNQTQTRQIANFMRSVNAFQDIDVARRELREIIANTGNPRREQEARLAAAYEGADDAIQVLRAGGIFPQVVTHLTTARGHVTQAQRTTDFVQRRALIVLAIARLVQAKNAVATVAP